MKKGNKKQAQEIRALAKMREEDIDTTDIPEVVPTSPLLVGKFYRPIKQSITVRLDADVIAWLKSSGRGYQTRTNKMLRSLMEKQHQANKKAD
jgi:uncharacterized protein (DUF4415 family)